MAGGEGVRQHVIGSCTPYAGRSRWFAQSATAWSPASQQKPNQGLPPVPAFNEATWGRYPTGSGHITAHRGPPANGGVAAAFTLHGRARFRVWDTSGEGAEWDSGPGHLVILRGAR